MSGQETIRFSLFLVTREDRSKLREAMERIEKISKKEGIADRLEIIVSELINNAIKANLKRLYFQSKGFSLENSEDYDMGLKSFRMNYAHLNFTQYEKAMKLLDLEVSVEIDMSDKNIVIFVQNKNMMSALEEERLREKLKKIMQQLPEGVHDLYVHYGDEIEENTLGLAMAFSLFRDMGYNPSLFRVYNEGNYTKARIKIPLLDHYAPELKEEAKA